MHGILTRLAGVLLGVAVAIGPATAQTIGSAESVLNTVYGTPPGAAQTTLKVADGIAFKELLETASDGAVNVGFVDGSKLTVGQASQVTVDEFVFDPTALDGSGLITITTGALRFVTGAMPKGKIILDTPVATVGIRGTIIKIGVAPGRTVIALEEGAAEVRIKSTGRSVPLAAGQSLTIDAGGAQPVIDTVQPVGSAVVDLGWDKGVTQMQASTGAPGPRPTATTAVKPATERFMQVVETAFGTMPGGVLITGDSGGGLPRISKLNYSPQDNLFKINGAVEYRPPLPPALVRLVWNKLSDKGLPGTSLTRDSAIVFGGFEPYDPVGTMLIGVDWTAGNLMKFPEAIRDDYKMPAALKKDFPTDIDRDTLVIMFDFHNAGFTLSATRLAGKGVEVDPYYLPTVYVNGERRPQPERLGTLNGDDRLQERLRAFVDDFGSIQDDVSIDFVIRLTEVIDFVRYARASGVSHSLDQISEVRP
jgi:hypothetical protein